MAVFSGKAKPTCVFGTRRESRTEPRSFVVTTLNSRRTSDSNALLSPDYSWMEVWRMSGVDHIRGPDQVIQLSVFISRSGVEIHLSGERVGCSQYSGGTGFVCLGVWET